MEAETLFSVVFRGVSEVAGAWLALLAIVVVGYVLTK